MLESLTSRASELQKEKTKFETEITNYSNLIECLDNNEENSDEECKRCSKIFNLSNVIMNNQLDQGLHKEIISFEQTILDINEQEKPLLDSLIRKIEEIVKEIYPESSVVFL